MRHSPEVTDLDSPFWSTWRKVKPLVQKALARSNEYSIGDVLHYIATDAWQCWYTPKAVACGRIASYPNHKAYVIVLAAGDIADIVENEPMIAEFAREKGCKYVEIYGRRGWERALKGYKEQATVLRKVL